MPRLTTTMISGVLTCLALAGARTPAWAQVGPPPVIVTQPADQTVVAGAAVTFSVVVVSATHVNYKWRFNGNTISGANAATYTIASAQSSQAGEYSVEVKNSGGTVVSSNAVLSIAAPQIQIVAADWTSNGLSLQVTGPVATTYVTLASTDLMTWRPIATNTAALGHGTCTDFAATNLRWRFYRVLGR